MKVITIQDAIDQLLAVGSPKLKPHAATGLAKSTLHYIRNGCRRVSTENALRILDGVRKLDPAITGLQCGDRIEIAAETVVTLTTRIADLEAKVRHLTARVEAHESRLFRRLSAEARLAIPHLPIGRGHN